MSDEKYPEEVPAIVRAVDRLSRREKALLSASVTVAFVAGLWISLLLIPDAALDVPKQHVEDGHGGYWDAAYLPVPGFLIGASILVLLVGAWATWRQVAPAVLEGSE